jgi:hypothetical protein
MKRVVGVEFMRRSVRRRVLAFAAIVGATLLAGSAPAHAQLPSDPGAVDQYVEDVPTGGGSAHPTADTPTKTSVPGSLQEQINTEGGSDAALLTEVVSSSAYGAPQRPAGGGGGSSAERMERGDTAPSAAEASGVVSSAITAVEGGDSRRLLALLGALLAVSVATVVAVGVRQRRTGSG